MGSLSSCSGPSHPLHGVALILLARPVHRSCYCSGSVRVAPTAGRVRLRILPLRAIHSSVYIGICVCVGLVCMQQPPVEAHGAGRRSTAPRRMQGVRLVVLAAVPARSSSGAVAAAGVPGVQARSRKALPGRCEAQGKGGGALILLTLLCCACFAAASLRVPHVLTLRPTLDVCVDGILRVSASVSALCGGCGEAVAPARAPLPRLLCCYQHLLDRSAPLSTRPLRPRRRGVRCSVSAGVVDTRSSSAHPGRGRR